MKVIGIVVLLLVLGLVNEVLAHSSPSGWQYPAACCSTRDCRPVECETLQPLADGKVLDSENGQTYTKDKVFSSGDHHCHVCTSLGMTNGEPLCAFTLNGF